jgi:hypothetical protein
MPTRPTVLTQLELFAQPRDADTAALLPAQAAWDALVMPLRQEGDEVVAVTTPAWRDEACETIMAYTRAPVRWLYAEPGPLERMIAHAYGYEGLPEAA